LLSSHFDISCSLFDIPRPRRQPPLATQVRSFICTFFAAHCQSVFGIALFVKFALRLPLFTSAALLFFHSVNNPVGLLITSVFPQTPPGSLLIPAAVIFAFTVFTPIAQSTFAYESFAKLTLVFPLFAFGALLHSCLLICVSLLIAHSQPLLDSIFALYRLLFHIRRQQF